MIDCKLLIISSELPIKPNSECEMNFLIDILFINNMCMTMRLSRNHLIM